MKINTEPREDHQMKVVAEFESSTLEKYKKQAARKIANKARIPGFRPGKAPYDVISRLYGEPAIEEEAIELMVDDVYPQILTEAKITPAAPGTLEDISKEDPIKFTFNVPLEPVVDLGSYKEIRKEYKPDPVTKKQVDEFILRLQRTYATAEPVDRPAAEGDLVYLKLDATILKPGEDQSPELLKDSPLQLVIGEKDPDQNDYPYLGFGDNLKGLSANEEKSFSYTYPKDSKFEKLRGKKVEFHATIQSIKHLTLPEMNDEFAQSLGEFENIEKLQEGVKAQLENRQTSEYDQNFFDELLDQISAGAKVHYPPQVLQHEMEHVVDSVIHDLSHQKMELDAYLKTLNKEKDTWMEEDVKPAAKKRLERSLIMEEISKLENIQINKEELQAEVTTILTEMQGTTDAKTLGKQLKSEKVANALTMQAASRVLNRGVFNRLKDIAEGKIEIAQTDDTSIEKPKKSTRKTEKSQSGANEKAPVKPVKTKKEKTKIE